MSLLEIELQPDLWVVHDGIEAASEPRPIDEKIMGGIAIAGTLNDSLMNGLQKRLRRSFHGLRQDETEEYSACIAYSFDITVADEKKVDDALAEEAKRQNHGMLTHSTGQQMELWQGRDGKKTFLLGKTLGSVILSNGEQPLAVIYGLWAHR